MEKDIESMRESIDQQQQVKRRKVNEVSNLQDHILSIVHLQKEKNTSKDKRVPFATIFNKNSSNAVSTPLLISKQNFESIE
jgi:hypothetical protein